VFREVELCSAVLDAQRHAGRPNRHGGQRKL